VAFRFQLGRAPSGDVSVRLSGPQGTISGLRARPDKGGVLELSFGLPLIGPGEHTVDLYDDQGKVSSFPFTIA